MAQSNGSSAPAGPYDMIQPHQIRTIPILSEKDKETFQNGLEKLWQTVRANPKESELHQKAVAKIREVSKDLMQRLAKARGAAQNRPPNQQAGDQQRQQQSTQQPQNSGQSQSQQPVQQQNQNQQNALPVAPQQQRQSSQQGQQPSQPAGQGAQLSEQARKFLETYEVSPLPGMMPNTQEYSQHRMKVINQLQRCLVASDRYGPILKQINAREQQLQQMGQPPTSDMLKQRESCKQNMAKAKNEFERIKAENDRNKHLWQQQQRQNGQQGGNAAGGQSQAQPQNQQQLPQQAPTSQTSQPDMTQQQAANQMQFTSQAPTHQAQGQPTMPQQQPQQQQQQPQQPQQRPQPVPQQQQQNFPQGQQQSQQPGQAQPLTHQAAINAINRTYSDQIPQQQQQQPPSAPTSRGTPTGSQPPSSAFPNQQTTNSNTSSTKMPIPQKLSTPPVQPVQMAPSRPTFGAGPQGMVGQPALQKAPGFTLEGEEGRVLSKKKLDELVRQVTGGGEGLSPEVEEAVLTLADDFVDNVLIAACRLAKIRPNATLDIRDVQLVLERNYSIRVPGYSIDEVRTVRKFQPAAGWQQKMNAVQAAKVMGKNDV